MKIRALVLALALLALAGCGTAASSSPPAPSRSAAAAAAPSCHQQYETWKNGPARPVARRMEASLKRVGSAASVMDIPAFSAALHRAGRQASALSAYPMPRCADPHGYWGQLLARVTAAGDNAASVSGLSSVLLAAAPLQGVPRIEKRLTAELNRTVGRNR